MDYKLTTTEINAIKMGLALLMVRRQEELSQAAEEYQMTNVRAALCEYELASALLNRMASINCVVTLS